MTLDLTALEQAAAAAGRPGLHARVVPQDPRRGRWFRWSGDDLQVSERVVERLPPGDAQALMVQAILQQKQLKALGLKLGFVVSGLLALNVWLLMSGVLEGVVAGVVTLLLLAGCALLVGVSWSRAVLAADDATVTLLGEAEVLVRALNSMNQDTMELLSRSVPARPDLHRRAERLADKHQLRLPPERRSVPVLNHSTGCGAGWSEQGQALPSDAHADP